MGVEVWGTPSDGRSGRSLWVSRHNSEDKDKVEGANNGKSGGEMVAAHCPSPSVGSNKRRESTLLCFCIRKNVEGGSIEGSVGGPTSGPTSQLGS